MIKLSTKLQKAINFSAAAHEGQYRKDKNHTPYITHPYSVMVMASKYSEDENVLTGCLLHDVIEDCEISHEELASEFSIEIADIVESLSEPKYFGSRDNPMTWREKKDAYFAKLMNGKDEAILVAACDKMHNMQSYIDMTKEEGDVMYKFGSDGRDEKIWYVTNTMNIIKQRMSESEKNALTDGLVQDFEDKIISYRRCLGLN
jgi:(p)ppGpp synthase/HD superfamily hydrolase